MKGFRFVYPLLYAINPSRGNDIMTIERKELFSEKLPAGSRTYFFDVKKSADGIKYLVISESRQVG